MSNPMQAQQYPQNPQHQQQYPQTPQAPAEVPSSPGAGPMFMFVLLAIGVVSMLMDFVTASMVVDKLAGKVTDLSGNPVSMSWFNAGTMYVTLGFALIIGVLGILVRKGNNGARITGAIFAIIFALMGLGGILMTMLTTASADLAAESVGLGQIVPGWYFIGGIVLGLTQVVIAILAIVKLFGKQAAGYCKAA